MKISFLSGENSEETRKKTNRTIKKEVDSPLFLKKNRQRKWRLDETITRPPKWSYCKIWWDWVESVTSTRVDFFRELIVEVEVSDIIREELCVHIEGNRNYPRHPRVPSLLYGGSDKRTTRTLIWNTGFKKFLPYHSCGSWVRFSSHEWNSFSFDSGDKFVLLSRQI